MWLPKLTFLPLLAVFLPVSFVQADLPSCYRARCTHCSVVFIAQMCPNTCASCYGTDPQRIPTGPRIRPGNAGYRPIHLATGSTSLPSQPRIHGQPTSNTGPSHHSLSSQTSVRHGVFSSSTTNEHQRISSQANTNKAPTAQRLPSAESQSQPVVQPEPQYHHQLRGPVQQISSNTGPQTPQLPQYPRLPQYPPAGVGSQVPAPQTALLPAGELGQPTAFGSSYAPEVPSTQYAGQVQPNAGFNVAGSNPGQHQAFGQNTQYFGQAQPQGQQQSITFFGQQQQQQPQQEAPQRFSQGGLAEQFGQQRQGANAGQLAGNSPFVNPFQPFLQQSYVVQEPQPQQPFFQTFTVATPAPFLNTPAPQTFEGMSPNNNNPAQGTQQLQPLTQQFMSQSQPAYPQQGQLPNGGAFGVPPPVASQTQEQQALASSQHTYGPLTDSQRPRQIYNGANGNSSPPQEPLLATLAPSQPVAASVPAKQLNRFAAMPNAAVAASNSIDPAAMYVNKNGYAEKSGVAFPQPTTCSKQPNWEPCISKEIANQRFSNCCQRLGDGCSQLCSYDQTLTVLQLAVLTGRCPLGKVADMMICASGYEDATACCQAHNVFEMGYEHCRPYCNPAAGLPNGGMLAEKYRCLGKLSQIQRCFYVLQKP